MNKETAVVIIGGGATGTGILRDLSMRGVPAQLYEQGGLCHGTSSRFHGLLHSGGRYAVSDNEAAAECIEENTIVRRIGRQCIHESEGFFVLTEVDDPAYVPRWVEGCQKAGIKAVELEPAEALRMEPELNPTMKRVFQVPDAAVDGFRLVLHNAMSAARYGGEFHTYHEVLEILSENGRVTGVRVRDKMSGKVFTVRCQVVVNAAGSWSARMVSKAGIHLPLTPDKGTLIVFNRRCCTRVVNRLHKSGDGDIFVPNGSVTILGTTSQSVKEPDDFSFTTAEVHHLLEIGRPLFPRIDEFRILRVFAGTRPLYTPGPNAGRAASRGFRISDHAEDGLDNLLTIFGGKFTTYRLMAEKMTDIVCRKLGVTAPCRTADEALIPDPTEEALKKGRTVFLPQGIGIVADRLADDFAPCVEKTAFAGPTNPLICECEMVSLAEILHVAKDPSTHSLNDIRLRTRLGMGTCQGTFCGLRAASALVENGIVFGDPLDDMRHFVTERWKGTTACYWGKLAREMELTRVMYGACLGSQPADYVLPETAGMPRSGDLPASLPPVRSSRTADTVVVGAGLAGLYAALLAAEQGQRVNLICRGAGSLSIGTAAIDVLGMTCAGSVTGNPLDAIDLLPSRHPYRLLGREKTEAAISAFKKLTQKAGWPLTSGQDGLANALLPTSLGTEKATALFPASMDPAPLARARKILVCGIAGLRDSMPGMAAYGLRASSSLTGRTIDSVWLPSPWQGGWRVETALDVARSLEKSDCRDFLSALGKAAAGYDAVLVPPIAGTLSSDRVWKALCEAAGCPVVEMAGLPPGVTGQRVLKFLMDVLRAKGVTITENTRVTGCELAGDRVAALRTSHEDGDRRYVADRFVIATGGILSGGLAVEPGQAVDAILGVRLPVPEETARWARPNPFGPQTFGLLGMPVLPTLEPTLDYETPLVTNVRYAGRAVACQDAAFERCASGVALATAFSAVNESWL